MIASRRQALKPKDPEDRVPGWIYKIVLDWEESRSYLQNYGRGGEPLSEMQTLDLAHTLSDARDLAKMHAIGVGIKNGVAITKRSENRWYGSDGESRYTIRINPVPDLVAEHDYFADARDDS